MRRGTPFTASSARSLRCPSRRSLLISGANLFFYSIHIRKYKKKTPLVLYGSRPGPRDITFRSWRCCGGGSSYFHSVVSLGERRLGLGVESCLDTLLIINVYASMSYRAIHLILKAFGRNLWILSNMIAIVFLISVTWHLQQTTLLKLLFRQ